MAKSTKKAKTMTPRAIIAVKRGFARHAASRHLRAYLIDRNPCHIAAAWVDFRKLKVPPDDVMLTWMDRLAESVLNPQAARVRPKENTVRDLELYGAVRALQRKPIENDEPFTRDPYTTVAQSHGLTVSALKMIVSRVERALRDPYYAPRAFRKS